MASTPQRRTMGDLTEIFSSLDTTYFTPNGAPAVPVSKLPFLLSKFQARRNVFLMDADEMAALEAFCDPTDDQLVDLDTVMAILGNLNPTSPPREDGSTEEERAPRQIHSTLLGPDDEGDKDALAGSIGGTDDGSSMLKPDPTALSDGSPAPRRSRTPSTSSTISFPSSALSADTTLTSSPGKKKRTSIFGLALSRGGGVNSSGNFDEDGGELDVSSVVASGETYLGVPLDGPLGEGWDAEVEAKKLGGSNKAVEKAVVEVLSGKTYPQIRAVDRKFKEIYGKSLLGFCKEDSSLRGHVGFILKGLIMGPLNFDVELLHKALDGVMSKKDELLIDLLILRPPASLELLRVAYAHRAAKSNSKLASKHKHLDDAVLASYSGGLNLKVRKAWEFVLEGKWEDMEDNGEKKPMEFRTKLLSEDVDQLKVSLRSGGSSEIAAKILLGRSPDHLHSITIEYLARTKSTLAHAVEHNTKGTLEKILVYAVEHASLDWDGPGVWQEAKLLHKTMDGPGTRDEALSWKVVRAHWDRSRFKKIQQVFEDQRRKETFGNKNKSISLSKWIHDDTSGVHRDLLLALVASANLPYPTTTPADTQRLEAITPRSRVSSTSSWRSDDSSKESTPVILEATGELSRPPSPRSPPLVPLPPDSEEEEQVGDATPQLSSFPQFASHPSFDDSETLARSPSSTSMVPGSSSDSLNSSSSTGEGTRGHKSSSSLSFRQRTSPLDIVPRPDSAGSAPRDLAALRHTRPIAPSRRRQMSTDLLNSRGASEDPMSPPLLSSRTPGSGNTSPMFGRSSSSGELDRVNSPNDLASSTGSSRPSDHRRESSGSSVSSRRGTAPLSLPSSPLSDSHLSETSSPPSSIDTTSYHAPPISPVGDVGSSACSSNLTSSAYDFADLASLQNSTADYFSSGNDSSPEKASPYLFRRQGSTTSIGSSGGSRPGSLFFGEALGSAGASAFPYSGGRPASTVITPEQQLQILARNYHELTKKYKESEGRYESSASVYEQELFTKDATLSDLKGELQSKRREEKELRSAEKQHLSQIASLEGDITRLTKNLERNRELYETMKRNYQDQCTEAEKLRTMVAETRHENKSQEEAAMQHDLQVQQFERDKEMFQANIAKLEEELIIARQAQESLNDQKQENLVLKETIDRLRFDLDELRSAGRKSLFLNDTGSSTSLDRPGGSYEGSMSKSLGRELARRLAEAEADADDAEDDEGDGGEKTGGSEDEQVDLVVTTHRRVKKRGTRTTGPPAPPTITHIEETTVVHDAQTQTLPVPTTDRNVQTDLSAVREDLLIGSKVIETQTPSLIEKEEEPKSEREQHEELAKNLGISLERLDAFVQAQKEAKRTPAPCPPPTMLVKQDPSFGSRRGYGGRWARLSSRMNAAAQAPSYFISVFPNAAQPYVSQVVESTTSFVLYSIVVYLTGVLSGALFLPLTHHHHASPYHLLISSTDRAHWQQVNTFGSAWGEGLLSGSSGTHSVLVNTISHWINEIVWGGVSVVRRVPV